jgi:hypothetical protein
MCKPIFGLMALATVCLSLLAPAATASILNYDLFKNTVYDQVSDASPVTPVGYFGSVGVISNNTTDFTAADVTSASPLSPMVLLGSGGNFSFATPFLATKSQLDADLPNGALYTYNISSGTLGSQSATLSTPASDAYSATVPFLTNSGFTALQGVNASSPISLSWNPYVAPLGVNTPLTFIGITRVSDGVLAFGTSGSNLFASTVVPGNTLQPGTQYDLDLVYSARIATPNAGFGGAGSFASFDLRTDLIFTTAPAAIVPEPSSFTPLALGGLVLVIGYRLYLRRNSN